MSTHHERLAQIEAESGLQLLQSLTESDANTSFGLEGLDPIIERYGLSPGDIIDFQGSACTGKTTFLYAIITATVLPTFWKHTQGRPSLRLGGKAKSVVFVDMDQGFSVGQLKQMLHLRILSQLHHQDPTDSTLDEALPTSPEMLAKIDQLVLSCLRNVHVFTPQDAISTVVLLRTLDQYLLDQTTTLDPPCPAFAYLFLDSISSFYWQERSLSNHSRILTLIMDALHRLVPRWKMIYISTSWTLQGSNNSNDKTTPDSFRARLKYRFLLLSKTLYRFESERELVQAWKHRSLEQDWSNADYDNEREEEEAVDQRESGTSFAETHSLFQAQMILPAVDHPELFRFSVSSENGINSFNAPVH